MADCAPGARPTTTIRSFKGANCRFSQATRNPRAPVSSNGFPMMRVFSLLLPLLFATRFAMAQPLPDRAPLSGVTLDSSGKPLPGAVITLRRQESNGPYVFWGAVAASDARGVYRFANAEAGRYFLSAEVPGFAPIANQSVSWRAGDAPLRLQFQKLVTLRLEISDLDGEKLSNAPLWVRLRDGEGGAQTTRRAITNQAGIAELSGLLPATYAVFVAAAPGFAIQNGLALGSDKSLELRLARGASLSINVTQTNAVSDGARQLGGAFLLLTPENSAEATRALGSSAATDENVALLGAGGDALSLVSRDGDGQIEIGNLPPGRFLARLILTGYAPTAPRPVALEGGQTARLDFELTPAPASVLAALTLDLRVKDATGNEMSAPAGEFAVRVLPIDTNGALAPEMPAETSFLPGGNAARRALADAPGQITLFPLPIGRYRVFVAPRAAIGTDAETPEAASQDISVPAGGARATFLLKPQ